MSLSEFDGTQDLYISSLITGAVQAHHVLTSKFTSLAFVADTVLLQNESGFFQLKDGVVTKSDIMDAAADRTVVIDGELAAAVVMEGEQIKRMDDLIDVKLLKL